MKHIHESIIGRKNSIDPGKLMPGDIVEYDSGVTYFWRFIPKGYIPDNIWEDILNENPPKNSNLLVTTFWSNNKFDYCAWVDIGNITRLNELSDSKFGLVWRQKDKRDYKKPGNLRIKMSDLNTALLIKEE